MSNTYSISLSLLIEAMPHKKKHKFYQKALYAEIHKQWLSLTMVTLQLTKLHASAPTPEISLS